MNFLFKLVLYYLIYSVFCFSRGVILLNHRKYVYLLPHYRIADYFLVDSTTKNLPRENKDGFFGIDFWY
jgi:hypothetical protein